MWKKGGPVTARQQVSDECTRGIDKPIDRTQGQHEWKNEPVWDVEGEGVTGTYFRCHQNVRYYCTGWPWSVGLWKSS